jgi:predicted nucleic acid-binding protein
MLVLDASCTVEFLLQTERGRRVAVHVAGPDVPFHAPELLWLEVASAFRRAIRLGACSPARATLALEHLAALGITPHRDIDLAGRAFALRDRLTIYDGVYVALAEALSARLLTCDNGMAAAAGGICEAVLVA